MSLRVWLPLDGDLRNLGTSSDNFTINTTPIYVNNGKIGKAMSTGQITMSAQTAASILNNNSFSFACWIYVNAATGDTTNRAMLFGNSGMTAPNNRKFSIFQYPSCNDLHLSWQNDVNNTTFTGGVWSGYFPSYQWTHLAITYQNPNGTIYINGIKKATFSGTSNSASFEFSTVLFQNCPNQGRYLNDYRIYDHCLSAAEVHEIAQGLVLHYKLDGSMGGINSNLAQGSKSLATASSLTNCNISKRGSPTIETRTDGFAQVNGTAAWQGFSLWSNSLNLKVNTTYTYSFYGYTSLSASTNAGISFYPMMYNSAGTRDTSSTLPISVMGGAFTNSNAKQIGKLSTTVQLYWATFTWNQTMADIIANGGKIELSIQIHGTFDTGRIDYLWAPKLEIGEKPTGWTPSIEEMGINITKIEDSSGYNHNGIIVGNPSISSSSARYSAYTSFDGSDDAINAGLDFEVEKTQNFTFCAWIYSDRWNTGVNDYFLSSQESGGFLIRTLSGNTIRVRVNAFTAADYSANSYIDADATLASIGITTAGWHFVAGVYTTSNLKLYVDGILRTTNTITTYGLHFNGSTNLFLGAECAGSKPTTFCKCGLSDVRIYNTALTADDILALYHTGARVDNKGGIHTYEFNEENGLEENTKFINNSATSMTYDSATDTYTIVSPVGTSTWGYGVRLADTPALMIPYGATYRWTAEVWTPVALTVQTDYNNTATTTWAGNDNDATGTRLTSSNAIPANTWTRIYRGASNTNTGNTNHLPIRDYSSLGLVTNGQSGPVTWKVRHLQWYLVNTTFKPQIKKTGVIEAEHFTEVEQDLNKPAQFNKQMFSVNGNEFIEL